ncbi:MAG: hypothetical protein AB7I38_08810 [Dehalococcoidia bacterium]
MKPGAVVVVGLGLFILLAAFAAGLSFTTPDRSPSAVTPEVIAGTPGEPSADGSSALVYATYRTSSGFRMFRIEVIPSKYAASVGFVPPAECRPPDGVTLTSEGLCTGVPAEGVVLGRGTTRSGPEIVIVQVPISDDCFEVLDNAEPWPSAHDACRDT